MNQDCRKDLERLSEYLDGELDDEVCREIETHFRHCPACTRCVESMKKTIELCRKAATEEIPITARERLRSMLRHCLRGEEIM